MINVNSRDNKSIKLQNQNFLNPFKKKKIYFYFLFKKTVYIYIYIYKFILLIIIMEAFITKFNHSIPE